MLTFVKNVCRSRSFQEFYAEADHEHIVQLTDNWDEIRDKLNRASDVERRASADKLRVPRHPRVNQSPKHGAVLSK